jgi:hypothetical protein
MKKPCEYCGCDLPLGVDKDTRRIRSRHFSSCKARPSLEVEPPAPIPDAITDNSESPEYKAGWNECRELTIQMRKK